MLNIIIYYIKVHVILRLFVRKPKYLYYVMLCILYLAKIQKVVRKLPFITRDRDNTRLQSANGQVNPKVEHF